MTETSLTVVEQQEAQLAALLASDPSALMPAGIDRLEPGDTGMPPRLRISQPNRPIKIGDDKVEAGKIVNTLTGDTFDALDIVVLVFLGKTRVMWPEQFNADNDPVCLSNDGHEPAQDSDLRPMTDPQAGPCAECEFAKFGDNSEPPRCKVQRNFLVWMVEQAEPAIVTMQSTALKAGRQLTTLARTKGLRSSVTFTTQNVEDGRGSWVVPAFTAGRKLTAGETLAIIDARNELQNLVVTADVEATETDEPEFDAEPDELPF